MRMAEALQRNVVRSHGAGTPIVLVHGFGCDQTMWDRLEERLPGHRIITYDLTGMGESDYAAYDTERHGSLEGHAADLIEILDDLPEGPFDIVGHSVSALIAGLVGAERPDLVRRIVMLCPNPCYVDDPPYHGGFTSDAIDGLLAAISENYQGWAGTLAGMVAGPEPETTGRLQERFCKNDPAITRHFAEVTFKSDLRTRVPSMGRPTLIIDMTDDAIAPASVGDFMVANLPDPHRITLDGRGHAPHMTAAAATATAVLEFLA